MAYTVSMLAKTDYGNHKVHHIRVTSDGAEANLASTTLGFGNILSISYAPQSATSAPKFAINENSSGTAAAGGLGVSGSVSGDEYLITVYGR